MKIALVIPRLSAVSERSFYDFKFGTRFLFSKKHISYLLAIPTLISLTPPGHEIRVFDENLEEIDYTWNPDIVGITVRTMFAKRAYEVSEEFRSMGVKTVLGGIHPSMCPEDSLLHCDSVVIGEAEDVWSALLDDAEKGELKKVYKAEKFADLKSHPAPDRSLLSRKSYLLDIVQTTKGCPFNCEFCSVHAYDGQKIRSKTVDQVLEEIRYLNSTHSIYKKKTAIFFADDNIIADKVFARSLFTALRDQNINWMCQASINISRYPDLLDLMNQSGCGAVFIGFESLSQDNLEMMNKKVNRRHEFLEAIRNIQSHGILVHSSFIVGYDCDSKNTFDELIKFIQESNLLMPLINILTPLPGTTLYKRLEKQGRIIDRDWSKYDTQHVVFKPMRMSPEELLEGYRKVLRSAYSFDSILTKLRFYWDADFWKQNNISDPVKFVFRLFFALRLATLLVSTNMERSRFILKILPIVFNRRVRVSTILALLNNNDFAYTV